MPKDRIQISFNSNQLKKLREESQNQGESIATLVRRAVNNYFFLNQGVAK